MKRIAALLTAAILLMAVACAGAEGFGVDLLERLGKSDRVELIAMLEGTLADNLDIKAMRKSNDSCK